MPANEIIFNNDIATTACFTGHRPEKFPFLPDDDENCIDTRMRMLKSMLYNEVRESVLDGYKTFITGMARGVDIWGAMSVLALKKEFPDIKLIGVSPYKAEINRLRGSDIYTYCSVEEQTDRMIYLSDSYYSGCFFVRNRFMVDHSSLLIGVVNNMKSGTGNTIKYARSKGLKTRIIDVPSIKEFLHL